MQLPRRVPWASLAELDQVCSWIYSEESDTESKIQAVNRLSAWKNITQLPHALDATLSLLAAVLQDTPSGSDEQQQHSRLRQRSLALQVRHSYATALIRLVNGLVDPLQQGVYARSIASIAAQIGLPQWLVDLRHASTHEELPSLELLRSGARESLTWLLHNYFLPTLTPPQPSSSTSTNARLSPLTPLLKEYKTLLKTTIRDASLKTRYKGNITKILRNVERWIGEAKVAATSVTLDAWGASSAVPREDTREEPDGRERWALQRLSDELLERGGFVPVSSKKRQNANDPDSQPKELLEIWSPLLSAVASNHPGFPYVIVAAIVNTLLESRSSTADSTGSDFDPAQLRKDLSFERCIARWAAFVMDQWGVRADETEDGSALLRREDVVTTLLTALGSTDFLEGTERPGAKYLLELLCRDRPELLTVTSALLPIARHGNPLASSIARVSDADATDTMQERLAAFLALSESESLLEADSLAEATAFSASSSQSKLQQKLVADVTMRGVDEDDSGALPEGWSLIPQASWRACPIGVYGST